MAGIPVLTARLHKAAQDAVSASSPSSKSPALLLCSCLSSQGCSAELGKVLVLYFSRMCCAATALDSSLVLSKPASVNEFLK